MPVAAMATRAAACSRGLVASSLRSRRAWQGGFYNAPPLWGLVHPRHGPCLAVSLGSRCCAAAARPAPAGASGSSATASSPASSSGVESSGGPPAEAEADKKEEKKEEKKEPMGWGMFWVYAMGSVSGIYFFIQFYKEDYSLHRTEIAIVNAIRRLPLYYPPGNLIAWENGTLDGEGLDPALVQAFAEWFVILDMQQAEGVIRDDVLELFSEMGFDDAAKPCRRYLEKGDGQLEERRRMSGCGMQESISLLAELALRAPPVKVEDGAEPPPDPKTLVGPSAVELLRKKMNGIASISAGAQAMQQAMQQQSMQLGGQTSESQPLPAAASLAQLSPFSSPASSPSVQLSSFNDDDDEPEDSAQQVALEEARLKRLEDSLMALLESRGSLSEGEESRLRDIRAQRVALRST